MTLTRHRPPTAQENRERKARAIALLLWRLGLGIEDLHALPFASRNRRAPTMTRFAREAYAAAGVKENPPSSVASDTWRIVAEKLVAMERWVLAGREAPERDLVHEAHLWRPATEPAPPLAVEAPPPSSVGSREGTPNGTSPGLEAPRVRREVVPRAKWPRGWEAVIRRGPVEGLTCTCGVAAVIATMTSSGHPRGRCAGHPPAPGDRTADPPTSDDWGAHLDFTPKSCVAPIRCYCGRHPIGQESTRTETGAGHVQDDHRHRREQGREARHDHRRAGGLRSRRT